MSVCDRTLARGLARDRMERITKSSHQALERVGRARMHLLKERCRDLSRKMRPRDFDAFARDLSRLRSLPAVVDYSHNRTPAPATVRLSCIFQESMTRVDSYTSTPIHDYKSWTLVHSRFTSDGKRFNEDDAFTPMMLTDHAVQRYVERAAGEDVSLDDLADLVQQSGTWALVYLRAHTANSLKGLPPQLVAPVGDGVLLGYLALSTQMLQPLHILRDRNGQRIDRASETLPSITVSWQTYLSRDMLYTGQATTLARLEPVLWQTRKALARDPDVARGFPRPDTLPAATLEHARASLTPLLRTLRETGMDGFADLADLYPGNEPGDMDVRDAFATHHTHALENTRRLLWPSTVVPEKIAA